MTRTNGRAGMTGAGEIADRLQKVYSYQYIGEFARDAIGDAIEALRSASPQAGAGENVPVQMLVDATIKLNGLLDQYWEGNNSKSHIIAMCGAQLECKQALDVVSRVALSPSVMPGREALIAAAKAGYIKWLRSPQSVNSEMLFDSIAIAILATPEQPHSDGNKASVTDAMVEAGARVMATRRGHKDCDHLIVTSNVRQVPVWQFYTEEPRAILEAALSCPSTARDTRPDWEQDKAETSRLPRKPATPSQEGGR